MSSCQCLLRDESSAMYRGNSQPFKNLVAHEAGT